VEKIHDKGMFILYTHKRKSNTFETIGARIIELKIASYLKPKKDDQQTPQFRREFGPKLFSKFVPNQANFAM